MASLFLVDGYFTALALSVLGSEFSDVFLLNFGFQAALGTPVGRKAIT